MNGRRGVTLVELLVVLAVLGVAAGVAGFSLQTRPTIGAARARSLAAARREALVTGRALTVEDTVDGRRRAATVHPDGRVVADSGFADAP